MSNDQVIHNCGHCLYFKRRDSRIPLQYHYAGGYGFCVAPQEDPHLEYEDNGRCMDWVYRRVSVKQDSERS